MFYRSGTIHKQQTTFDASSTSCPEDKRTKQASFVLFTRRIAPRRLLPVPIKLQSVDAGPLVVERSPEEGLCIARPERMERDTVVSDPALLWTRRRYGLCS